MSITTLSAPDGRPLPAPATIADLIRPATETVGAGDHAAAASYLMHHAGTTALLVLGYQHEQPVGVITAADLARAVADGKDLNEIHIHNLLTTHPAPLPAATSIRDAAQTMLTGGHQQLPVIIDADTIGLIDLTDVLSALPSQPRS